MEKLTSQTCFHHHLVSSCGKLIYFHKQGSSGTDSERGEVLFSRLSFKREDNLFLNEANGVAVISTSKGSHLEIIKCRCALHTQKRVIVPCVLVAKHSKKLDDFHYSLLCLTNSNQLEPCLKFKLPYKVKEDVCILEGPTLMWSHADHVWYTSLQTGVVKQIPFHMSRTAIGELPLNRGLFVLGLLSVSESDQEVSSQTCGYFIQDEQKFDGNLVLPHPYISITCCLLVLSAIKTDDVLKTSLVVATSNQQLLYVENGVVKDVCQLPFTQPEDIQLVNTGKNGDLFVISFSDSHVCAVWKDTLSVASKWSEVVSLLVDDFLGIGTDQMLLIFKEIDATSQPLRVFLITDLCGVSYSSVRADEPMKPPCAQPENYFFTIQALESRLLSGFTVLQELQREERAKETVIQQSLLSLTDATTRHKPALTLLEQESLAALWDCDETKDEIEDDKMQDVLTVSSNPQVDKLWHRVTGDRLVVGVILSVDSTGPVSGVSLFTVTEADQSSTPTAVQTQSQVFWLPTLCPSTPSPMLPSAPSYASSSSSSSSSYPEPAAKRSRQQHSTENSHDLNTGRVAVTALAALTPLLNSGRVKCHVMLHYAPTRDSFHPASNPAPTVLHCGQVVLDLHHDVQTQLVSRPEVKTDESLEDLLSLMALLDHWTFHIDSPDYSLGDIVGQIQKRVGCKRIEVSPQHLLINSAGPSAPMLLRWHQITPFQAELSVHTSELQMLQFLDLLLASLPGSCTMEPVKATRGQSEAQIFSLALEREITSLRDCVSAMLSKEKDDDNKRISSFISPDPRCEEALQRCRDDWQRDVERSKRNLCPLVDVQRYRASTESFFKELLGGDLAALIETQKTLYS
ncbi:Fanconi anemia group B protein [Periophthalmus magnuspinnatus]|uniref:Fanconi anemia group B protein n=1 Tax=Periophthalmus magnuspinnatus TaxID=409849 RepID=UPI00145AA916|nr:Fanconi anemia group B protein [Periophthalmus magnuspinnatus]